MKRACFLLGAALCAGPSWCQITNDRLYVSVSLYFLLGMTWYAFYTFINSVQPGSFAEAGVSLTDRLPASKTLYFSYATLTTLGYGDIVPVKPLARIVSVLEAVAGVLYIAITVARLVASSQASSAEDSRGPK